MSFGNKNGAADHVPRCAPTASTTAREQFRADERGLTESGRADTVVTVGGGVCDAGGRAGWSLDGDLVVAGRAMVGPAPLG